MKKFLVLLVVFVSFCWISFTPKINAGGQWTKEEIDILTHYHNLGCENYATILQAIHKLPSGGDRTIDEVEKMYHSLFLCHTKKRFTPDEDKTIKRYVSQYGDIKKALPHLQIELKSRSPRSIRDRYKNYIAPPRKVEWSPEEDILILQRQKELGNKWSAIASFLPGKTSTDIKNRWHHHLKKNIAHVCSSHFVPRIAPVINSAAIQVTNSHPTSNTSTNQNQNENNIVNSIFDEFFDSNLIDNQFDFFYDGSF